MALERDLELLDDYLAGKLTGQDKAAFEETLKADQELQQELRFQQDLIEGIRQARITELKTMLNNIPVAPGNVGTVSTATKIISSLVVVGIVTTAVYLYVDKKETTQDKTGTEVPTSETVIPVEPERKEESNSVVSDNRNPVSGQSEIKAEKPANEPKPAVQPKLDVYTPETEEDQIQAAREHAQLEIISKAFITSSIEVETDSGSRKYNFHYMFKENKLVLFGSFENNLYEILEFIAGDQRTVFLYYNNEYYLLDLTRTAPTLLIPIKDKALLAKLKQYRGN